MAEKIRSYNSENDHDSAGEYGVEQSRERQSSWETLGEVSLKEQAGQKLKDDQKEVANDKEKALQLEKLRAEAQNASRERASDLGERNQERNTEKHNSKDDGAEALTSQYETELNTPEDVLRDLGMFVIQNGKVYNRETGEEQSDIDTVLRVKTSRFLFNEAKDNRNMDKERGGKRFVDRGKEYYLEKAMQRYAIRDEENDFATNKLVRNLVENNSLTETMLGDELEQSKFSLLVGPKAEYGRALLERKFRQRGREIADLQVKIDTSEFVKNGYSTVTVDLKTEKLHENNLKHPAAEQLTKLDEELLMAKQNHDTGAAKKILEQLRKTVRENPLEMSSEDWDKADKLTRERFMKLKMKEARVLGDKDTFRYWNANLKRLN